MKGIFKLITAVGFFLLIGTAGAGDMDVFSIERILFQITISIALMFFGSFGILAMTEKEKKRRRHTLKNV